jgi:hypothetical protein
MNRQPNPHPLPRLRRLLYAVVPALALLLTLEGGLRLLGVAPLDALQLALAPNPMDESAYAWPRARELGPWFLNDGETVHTNEVLLRRGMHRLEFDPRKAHDGRRWFAMGGSTTQGEPYTHLLKGFPQRIEEQLVARAPEHAWTVLNTGVGGMDSNGFPALAAEILMLEPDGLIIYAGNNELHGHLMRARSERARVRLERWGNSVATVRLGRLLWRHWREPEKLDLARTIQHQRDALEQQVRHQQRRRRDRGLGGPGERVAGDEPWLPSWPARTDQLYLDTLRSFHDNMENVIEQAAARDVPVLLAIPPANTTHPPELSLVRGDLGTERAGALTAELARARGALEQGDTSAAIALLDAILEEDPSLAAACHLRGLIAREAGELELARELLLRAIDRDFLGRRATSHMRSVVEALCERHDNVRCVDVRGAFERASPTGLPGLDLFADFCHPNIEQGIDIVAEAFTEAVLNSPQEAP